MKLTLNDKVYVSVSVSEGYVQINHILYNKIIPNYVYVLFQSDWDRLLSKRIHILGTLLHIEIIA